MENSEKEFLQEALHDFANYWHFCQHDGRGLCRGITETGAEAALTLAHYVATSLKLDFDPVEMEAQYYCEVCTKAKQKRQQEGD